METNNSIHMVRNFMPAIKVTELTLLRRSVLKIRKLNPA